jgi:selenocysteine-specific elongation factor
LQTHKRKEETAAPGSRTAANISGIPVDQVKRGDVLVHPGDYSPTRRIDVHFRLLADAVHPLRHNTEVKLFIGSAELLARVRLLGEDELAPGQEGWLQMELSEPTVAVRGDHYILRRPSPSETLGGGVVIDPRPKKRHKRFSANVISSLESLSHGSPADILYQALASLDAASLREVIARANMDETPANAAAYELYAQGLLIVLDTGRPGADASPEGAGSLNPISLVISQEYWNLASERIVSEVKSYHRTNPLRPGLSREELKSRLKNLSRTSAKVFNAILNRLVMDGRLEEAGNLVRLPGFAIRFNAQQEASCNRLLAKFAAAPYSPPSVKESQAEVGEDVFQALLETGRLVSVAPDVVFRRDDYDSMVAQLHQLIAQQGQVSAAQVRDHFNTSRKYALAFLEHLDANGITIREGDFRRIKNQQAG